MNIEVNIPSEALQALRKYMERMCSRTITPGKEGEFMRLCIEQLLHSSDRNLLWEDIEECYTDEELDAMDLFE